MDCPIYREYLHLFLGFHLNYLQPLQSSLNDQLHRDSSFAWLSEQLSHSLFAYIDRNLSSHHNFDVFNANSNAKKSLNLHVENGQIFETRKDKEGNLNKTLLTESFVDWIDYWAVDFDYQKRKEIIYIKKDDGSFEEQWTGKYIFENQWQSFRSKDNELELVTPPIEMISNERIVAVRVVDIFGIDTLKVIKVTK